MLLQNLKYRPSKKTEEKDTDNIFWRSLFLDTNRMEHVNTHTVKFNP